ncbi:hypothetical protein G6F46_010000 [Rhizopus delemar]|uniref:Septin-type G domain-containing protein n=3 Tax=Rhizopus TaxID=4842 RepID=I1BS15_RHIO9|nr:hypothetical protein RO3G_03700 [Rhizopus delemar RA 99-880]KAG1041940.1 hypothetical protein G6F43_012001 [Rhizopus delemar]KAG1534955.1 hypothetical protein G6F51_011801 [Rhizopus arrhizus]KAG1447103.1 hypothetical protein G6F55_011255 [Rhizopus delemar]KAG1489329.1 hypothetical protein G6F54_011518 [Rhizopus delemar]|eukprot:EIE78995.1 hypothetical protein RO3G_03700 [Rhizopus delemar RA 99-880]
MLYSQKISHHSRSKKDAVSYLNVIVVGAAGSGKTCFIRTLYEALRQDMIQGTFKESKHKSLKGCVEPTEEMYTISMQIEDGGRRTALTLTDTPGFTSNSQLVEQLKAITQHIDSQFARTLAEESKVKRDAKASDTHVHACIYFMSESNIHGLSEVDKFILKALSSRVNVIPVLSKADTLSTAHVEKLKNIIKEEIFDVYRIPIYGHIQFDEDDEDEEMDDDNSIYKDGSYLSRAMDMLQECVCEDRDEDARSMLQYLRAIPFSLINYEEDPHTGRPIQLIPGEASGSCYTSTASLPEYSSHQNNSLDSVTSSSSLIRPQSLLGMGSRQTLGRRYPWAAVECFNPTHCDFLILKRILLSSHREMLKIDTFECFYERYRTQQLIGNRTVQNSPEDTPELDQELGSPMLS